MIALLIFLSGYVWNIDVSGNVRISSNVILDELEAQGFYVGASKKQFNVTKLENSLMDKFYDLAWITININGSTAHIEIKERDTVPPMDENLRPSNLIASEDAVIVKMEIIKGKPIATVGSGVVKGEILVAGLYNDKKDNMVLEYSRGKVTAEVETGREFSISLSGHQKISEERQIFYDFCAFGKDFDLSFRNKPTDSEWKIEKNETTLTILGLRLPFKITENIFIKDITHPKKRTVGDAKRIIYEEIEHFEKTNFYEGKIITKNIVWKQNDDKLTAVVDYVVHKDIAVVQYIESDLEK